MEEIATRLRYLCDVGIGYLTLDRQSRTLSGGEVQRINLTTALGTSLVNTLFVLDEPSIGLHPRDMQRINLAMQRLRDAGNTLVVVEHDPAVMLAADRIIDMGPGPGVRGGQIVFDGTPAQLRQADTLDRCLPGRAQAGGLGLSSARWQANTPNLILEGASAHNLQNVDVDIPLQRLVTVTGVSGSGKSTPDSRRAGARAAAPLWQAHRERRAPLTRLLGADHLADVVLVDQSPIGKTARSNPVSYVRRVGQPCASCLPPRRCRASAATPPRKFSFNSGDGRCPTCGGSGFEHVEMQFLVGRATCAAPTATASATAREVLEVTHRARRAHR